MKKWIAVCLLAMACGASNGYSQQPSVSFGMGKDVIGETLSQFKQNNQADSGDQYHPHFPRCSGDVSKEPEPVMPQSGERDFFKKMNAYQAALDAYRHKHDVDQTVLDGDVQYHFFGAEMVCEVNSDQNGQVAGFGAKVTYYFVDDKLDRIEVKVLSEHFPYIEKAIYAKFGDPLEQRQVVYQNGMGASFTGLVDQWKNGSSVILLAQVGVDVDHSALSIYNAETTDKIRKEKEKNAINSF